jgi:hypothetical protein
MFDVYWPVSQEDLKQRALKPGARKAFESNSTARRRIVAGFCAKCGAAVPAGAAACAACGAPLAAVPVAAAAPVPPVPAKQGTSAVKIILIILAVFVGLGVLGAGAFGFFVWRVAHAVHVAQNGKQMALSLPGGSFSANTGQNFSSSDLGTDIYPGASAGQGGMRMTLPTGTMVSAVYLTSDSKEQVIGYYKNKFGSANTTAFDSADGSVITYTRGQQESVVVTVTSNPAQYDGKTQIHIVHTTANKPS